MAMVKGMKQMVGSPGTWSEMALRVSQCLFAVASVCVMPMVTDLDFTNNPGFCFVNTMMILQIMWSLGLACLDIYAMRNKKDLHQRALVFLLVVGDGIMALLTFIAAYASAGASTFYVRDVHFCRKVVCGQIVLSIVLAFITSLLAATSFFYMLALHVSFSL